MTGAQKGIVAGGLLALLVTSFAAPYRFTARNRIGEMVNGDGSPLRISGTLHAPLWAAPDSLNSIESDKIPKPNGHGWNETESIQLDAGRLGIWWAGIAALTIVGVVLASPTKRP